MSGIIQNPALLEIHRFIVERNIEAMLPPVFRRQGLVRGSVERLGGLTNRNYRIRLGEYSYVLRVPGRGTRRFIDRSVERSNHESAARMGFTPPFVYFDPQRGVKLTYFLEEARALDPAAAGRPETIVEVAGMLAKFHRSGVQFDNEFNVFRLARIYERIARNRFARFYEGYARVRDRVLRLEGPLALLGGERTACHNDLVPENFLETADRLVLIDWEYSGMNDPAWDLASYCLESDLGETEMNRFLFSYLGAQPPQCLRMRMDTYRLLQDFLWSLWALLQESAHRDPLKARGYRDYGLARFERARRHLPPVESRLLVDRSREGNRS